MAIKFVGEDEIKRYWFGIINQCKDAFFIQSFDEGRMDNRRLIEVELFYTNEMDQDEKHLRLVLTELKKSFNEEKSKLEMDKAYQEMCKGCKYEYGALSIRYGNWRTILTRFSDIESEIEDWKCYEMAKNAQKEEFNKLFTKNWIREAEKEPLLFKTQEAQVAWNEFLPKEEIAEGTTPQGITTYAGMLKRVKALGWELTKRVRGRVRDAMHCYNGKEWFHENCRWQSEMEAILLEYGWELADELI